MHTTPKLLCLKCSSHRRQIKLELSNHLLIAVVMLAGKATHGHVIGIDGLATLCAIESR